MQLGYSIPNNQGVEEVGDLVDLAVTAETAGYHSVWVSEHLFHATYVEERLGDRPYYDALTLLTAVGCATDKVRLGTSVLVLPWHHPAQLGKSIATLDRLSCGRVDLGIGVAVTADEFANLGVDFRTRGARTNDTLAALQHLFSDERPAHEGRFYRFSGLRFEPKPVQDPLPIHVGGGSPAALRRVAAYGQGWHALGKSPTQIVADLATLDGLLAQKNRSRAELYVSIRCTVEFLDEPWERAPADRRTLKGTESEVQAILQAYADAGVDEVVIDPNSDDVAYNKETIARIRSIWRS